MFHAVKGTIPIRLSGIKNMLLKNVTIKEIKNSSPLASKKCGNYSYKTSFNHSKPGYFGADVRGISLETC